MPNKTRALFNHLIRPQQQRRRDGEAEGFGGLEVDDEFELRRLLDRQITWLRAFEDFVDERRTVVKHLGNVRPVAYQPAFLSKFDEGANRWYAIACNPGNQCAPLRFWVEGR